MANWLPQEIVVSTYLACLSVSNSETLNFTTYNARSSSTIYIINSGIVFVCLFVGHGPYLVIEKVPTCR